MSAVAESMKSVQQELRGRHDKSPDVWVMIALADAVVALDKRIDVRGDPVFDARNQDWD